MYCIILSPRDRIVQFLLETQSMNYLEDFSSCEAPVPNPFSIHLICLDAMMQLVKFGAYQTLQGLVCERFYCARH